MKLAIKLLKNRQSGQVLVPVLVFLALGGLVVPAMLSLGVASLKYHRVIEQSTLAMYAADAGVQYALTQIGNTADEVAPTTLPSPVNGRTVSVSAVYQGEGNYKITSTASATGSPSVTTESYAYFSFGGTFYHNALTAFNGDITLWPSSVSSAGMPGRADIYVNGNLNLHPNATVDGNVVATGTVNRPENVSGTVTNNLYNYQMLDTSVFLNEANAGTTYTGPLSITSNTSLGPAHITGDLYISNAIVTLTGTVWVDGELTVTGGGKLLGAHNVVAYQGVYLEGAGTVNLEDLPFVASLNGLFKVSGQGTLAAVIYAPNNTVELSGGAQIYGSIAAKTIDSAGNSGVAYPYELTFRRKLPGGTEMRVISSQTK